jgi:hypothetical protein
VGKCVGELSLVIGHLSLVGKVGKVSKVSEVSGEGRWRTVIGHWSFVIGG